MKEPKKEPRTKRFLRYIIANPGTTAAAMARALGCVQYYPTHCKVDVTKPPRPPRVDGRSTFNTVQSLQKRGLVRKVKVGTKTLLYSTVPEIETMHEFIGWNS